MVGCELGWLVGWLVGLFDMLGDALGSPEGREEEGFMVTDGALVGCDDGSAEGCLLGWPLGLKVKVLGDEVG